MKRIVCDIDDTISFTTNRDWENAKPNVEVIEKINSLYDQGWEIYLVTARGSLSCSSRQEASEKYREQIETWLEKHGVKYTLLSFEKYLAAYYVDDKSITPEEFVKLDIRELKAGWSGARVELRDGRVYKTADNSIHAAAWYEIAKHFFNTPKIHSLIGNTLCMDYVETDDSPLKMEECLSILISMSEIPYIPELGNDIRYYGERLSGHWVNLTKWYAEYNRTTKNEFGEVFGWNIDYVIPKLNKLIQKITNKEDEYHNVNKCKSFCHGDFSVDNILMTEGKAVLIDPIYEPHKNTWSSYLLDASKLLHSLRKYGRKTEYQYLLNAIPKVLTVYGDDYHSVSKIILQELEITQFLRVFKYAPDNEKPGIIQHIRNLFDELDD